MSGGDRGRRSVAAKPQKGLGMAKNGDKWIGKYGDARIVLAAPVGSVVWVPQQGGPVVNSKLEDWLSWQNDGATLAEPEPAPA